MQRLIEQLKAEWEFQKRNPEMMFVTVVGISALIYIALK
jgi:hypothetical protein